MEDLSMHILDIAENGVTAGATRIDISLNEDEAADRLTLEIRDNGSGMDEQLLRNAVSPFTTTRTTRKFGLGLPMLAQNAEAAGGFLKVESESGKGTEVRAEFQLSHIDRVPLGDLGSTLVTLFVGFSKVDFAFRYRSDRGEFSCDTVDIREELGDVPLSHPEAMKAVRSLITEGLREAGCGVVREARGTLC
jgi:hypothetical protein